MRGFLFLFLFFFSTLCADDSFGREWLKEVKEKYKSGDFDAFLKSFETYYRKEKPELSIKDFDKWHLTKEGRAKIEDFKKREKPLFADELKAPLAKVVSENPLNPLSEIIKESLELSELIKTKDLPEEKWYALLFYPKLEDPSHMRLREAVIEAQSKYVCLMLSYTRAKWRGKEMDPTLFRTYQAVILLDQMSRVQGSPSKQEILSFLSSTLVKTALSHNLDHLSSFVKNDDPLKDPVEEKLRRIYRVYFKKQSKPDDDDSF